MQVIRYLPPPASISKSTALSIGSFDGLHLGHIALIKRLVDMAQKRGLPACLLSFSPHPRTFFSEQTQACLLLTTFEEQKQLLSSFGIDYWIVLPFDAHLMQLSPQDFIKEKICPHILPSVIVIGEDHRFGKDRKGDAQTLMQFQDKLSYELIIVEDLTDKGRKISSSRIRHALLHQNIEEANALLGRAYTYSGKVVKGQQLGRSIGFPTANIACEEKQKLRPANGVYAVSVQIEGYTDTFQGMLNIGLRPTLTNTLDPVVEVYILDFDDMIYDKKIQVCFHHFMRAEKKFPNKDALIHQLTKDKISVSEYFLTHHPANYPL